MAERAKKPKTSDVSRDIQRFSNRTLELAKTVVDGSTTDADRNAARDLAAELPKMAAKARELAEAYRPGAAQALSEAQLDLAYVAAGGGIPSSIRLGWYIKEKGDPKDAR